MGHHRIRSEISNSMTTAVLIMIGIVMVGVGAEAQSQSQTDCAQKLAPCMMFLKSDNPPASCCDPIKEAVKTQLVCLCNLYSDPTLLAAIGLHNITEALHLPKACGVPVDTSQCSSSGPASRQPPPAVPRNGADRVIALTGFTSILMFLAAVILFLPN